MQILLADLRYYVLKTSVTVTPLNQERAEIINIMPERVNGWYVIYPLQCRVLCDNAGWRAFLRQG